MRTRSVPVSRRRRRTRTPLRVRLRSPIVYWSVVGLVAVTTVASIERAQRDLDRRAAALGPTTRVVVATADHHAGDRLDRSDVERRAVPRSIVPADALVDPPDDRRLRTDVSAGEVLTSGRFAPGRPSAVAARIPAGWHAVAVPLPPAALALHRGDHVDLLALGATGSSEVIVDGGLIIDSADATVTVALPTDAVADVADAVLAGTLTVALTGPD